MLQHHVAWNIYCSSKRCYVFLIISLSAHFLLRQKCWGRLIKWPKSLFLTMLCFMKRLRLSHVSSHCLCFTIILYCLYSCPVSLLKGAILWILRFGVDLWILQCLSVMFLWCVCGWFTVLLIASCWYRFNIIWNVSCNRNSFVDRIVPKIQIITCSVVLLYQFL